MRVRLGRYSTLFLRRVVWTTLLLLITSASIHFLTARDQRSSPDSSPSSLPSSINTSYACQLSLRESDGWFCQSDVDWKRRKSFHHARDRKNHKSDSNVMFFQNNWEPTFQCEFERRLGTMGDGGKWVCDVHRILSANNGKALIYSMGSNGDFTFEQAIKQELPNAEIHTFDMDAFTCPDDVCIFHRTRVGNGQGDVSKSLTMITDELGHGNRPIDLLKVDIEGGEFEFFESLFQSVTSDGSRMPYIRQILFEIHLSPDTPHAEIDRTHSLFELFRANHYAIFHTEANLYDPFHIYEFSLLRLNRAFFIAPT